jgi:type IV pilus biogenesis/stability protein PilW
MRIVRLMIVIVLAVCFMGASCQRKGVNEKDENMARSYFEMAVAYMQGGDATGALQELQKAVAINPYDPEYFNALGLVYYSKNKYGKAAANFKKAIEIDPLHSDARHNLGHLYLTQGRYELAIQEFDKALANDLYRNRPQTLNALGYSYFKRRDYIKAEKAFKECIDHDRMYFLSYGNLGKVYIALERYQDAANILERGLQLRPIYPEAMLDLSLVVCKQGNKQRGRELLKRVKQIDPYGEFGARADEYMMLCE